MNKILLANSYFLKHDPKEYKGMNLYAPLGTLYAASYLKQQGYGVHLFDTMLANSELDLMKELKSHKPDIFVIYDDSFNYLTKMCLTRMREAAFNMSEIAKDYGCKVIISSSDSTDHTEKYFLHKADYIIIGEGEITLGEIIGHLTSPSQKNLNEIEGLAYVENDVIVKTKKRNVIKDLNSLPFPDWSLIDVERYKKLWYKNRGYFSMNIVTTRGCPYHCNWCAKPIYGQVYNSRSAGSVVAEMKFLKEKYSPDHIWFCDDIFGLKPNWIQKFDETVNKENVKIKFKCLSRVDLLLKENNITHLASSGCDSVWVGAESGSQRILDAMDKGTTVEQIYQSRELLGKKQIKTCFFLQFGYSEETKEDIALTLKMVNDLMPDDIGISVSYPLPGTKFYDRVLSQMNKKQNWEKSDDFEMMFDGEYSTKYYRILHKKVHKEFRSRQILNNPLKKIKSLWKLPYYMLGWWWNSIKLNKSELKDKREKKFPELIEAIN
ncbi:MAG: radical SAM protein [bacterium]